MQTPTLKVTVTLEPLEIDERTTYVEVITMLNNVIHRLYGNNEESFGRDWNTDKNLPFFEVRKRWLFVYPVEGGSEGHYVHIDTMSGYGENDTGKPSYGHSYNLSLLKTFSGYERAVEIANVANFLLTSGAGR